jgi:hypothetical protein
VENPIVPSSSPFSPSSLLHLVPPRVSSLAHIKGKRDEAYTILAKYHAEGDENSEFVKAEYTQIEETLEAELKIAQMNQKDVLSTPGMRKRMIIASFLGLFIQWSGSWIDFVSPTFDCHLFDCPTCYADRHFLSPILDSIGIHDNRTKNVINLARFSWSLVNGTFIALIAPRYPRRRIFLVSNVVMDYF